jgi:hypothetical protein
MIPLNPMTVLWTVLVPLTEDIPDPDDVKPGWIGFTVVVLLAAAVVFLVFSFRKQVRKVDFEEPGAENEKDGGPGASGSPEPGSEGEPGTPRNP